MTQTQMEKKLEVLVVEDTKEHIDNALKLREEGYTVDVVVNYRGAISAIKKKNYDVVLTDLFFPWAEGADYPLTPGDKKDREDAITPQALGYPLAMVAIAAGVPYVGIVTDANHHNGVMAATTDQLGHCEEPYKLIPGAGNVPQLRMFVTDSKDWAEALRFLTRSPEEEKAEEAQNLERIRSYNPGYTGRPDYKTLLHL